MKYIRTKDGRVFDKSKETIVFDILYPRGEELISRTIDLKEDVLKQANTIEELCDKFVVYQPWTDSCYLTAAEECIRSNIQANYYKNLGYENPTVYGAIWTDRGLIYVAKTNEKGELELL